MSDEADIAALVNTYQGAKARAAAAREVLETARKRLLSEEETVSSARWDLLGALGIDPDDL